MFRVSHFKCHGREPVGIYFESDGKRNSVENLILEVTVRNAKTGAPIFLELSF